MSDDAPQVYLPRAHRASLPAVLAIFIGFGVGPMIGHPVFGMVVGLVLWLWTRSSSSRDDSAG